MAAGETPEDSGQHGADNVIRFPRDWFGSTDDLVPIGPAADRLEAEKAAAAAREAAESEDIYALNAGDFWGEGSEALHQPVDIPRNPAEAAETVPYLRAVAEVETAPSPVHRASAPRLGFLRLPSLPRLVTQQLRLPRAALLLAVMVIAGIALFVSGEFKANPRAATPTASGQAPSPVRTAQLLIVQNHLAKLSSDSQGSRRSASKVRELKIHRTSTSRHVVRRRQRTRATSHRVVRRVTASTSTATEQASTAPVAAEPAASSPAAVAPTASENVSEPQQATSSAVSAAGSSASGSATSGSSAAASGPSGLGGVVGKQCNPKCSS